MKMSERMARFDDRGSLVSSLNRVVKARYGEAIYVRWPSDPTKDEVFSLGCSVCRLVDDISSDEKVFRYIPLNGIRAIPVQYEKGRFYIEFPPRHEILKGIGQKQHALIDSAEKALLKTTRVKLAAIPLVRTGLNPILEVMTAVIMNIDRNTPLRIKEVGGQKRYLHFLEDLEFISLKDDSILPGINVTKYLLKDGSPKIKDQNVIEAVLGEIIENGFPYLKHEMGIQHLTPILRTANICYFNSLLKEDRVKLSSEDILSAYLKLYGNRAYKGRLKTLSYIHSLHNSGIFEEVRRNIYSPKEDDWLAFKSETKALV